MRCIFKYSTPQTYIYLLFIYLSTGQPEFKNTNDINKLIKQSTNNNQNKQDCHDISTGQFHKIIDKNKYSMTVTNL